MTMMAAMSTPTPHTDEEADRITSSRGKTKVAARTALAEEKDDNRRVNGGS
jgi:hypothetical protein